MDLKKCYRGKDFLSLHDYNTADLAYMLDVADFLKKEKKDGKSIDFLSGKTLGMIFQKNSTRTRVSFETGMYYLGGQALFLSSNDLQIGRGEPLKDTARTLSRYLDGIMIRTFGHQGLLDLAQYASIPVINGLTDLLHPCQVMADMQTIREHKGVLKGLKLVYFGDGNNMANSLMYGGAKFGIDTVIACPKGFEPDQVVFANALADAKESGAKIEVIYDPLAAAKDADVLYTDVWASMGQEDEADEKIKSFAGFQLNADLVAKAKKDAIILHCLPAKRGLEITDEVIESPQSVVFDEAENRLWAQMAIMALLLTD
jgi:ornithine carbamoyltransferase